MVCRASAPCEALGARRYSSRTAIARCCGIIARSLEHRGPFLVTLINTEIYYAFKEADASEERATAAAVAFATIEQRLARIESAMTLARSFIRGLVLSLIGTAVARYIFA